LVKVGYSEEGKTRGYTIVGAKGHELYDINDLKFGRSGRKEKKEKLYRYRGKNLTGSVSKAKESDKSMCKETRTHQVRHVGGRKQVSTGTGLDIDGRRFSTLPIKRVSG